MLALVLRCLPNVRLGTTVLLDLADSHRGCQCTVLGGPHVRAVPRYNSR